jgi:WD40 repeat protein
MKSSYILLALAASTPSLSGQSTFSGPASGYVFDSVEHSIRAIVGIPGAAYLGSQTASPPAVPWDLVSIAPNGKRALGVRGLSVNLIPDLSQPASAASIAQAAGPISRIVWSGDSTTAAIWSPAAGQLRRITGLDSAPVVHDAIDLTALAGVPSGWSLSPDGRYIALSSPASGTASVYLSDRDAAPVSIGSLGDPRTVAFSADGASLFVFNNSRSQIVLLAVPSGATAGSFDASPFDTTGGVATARRGIRGALPGRLPVASGVQDLAASPDGARLYAIGGRTLCGYDLPTGLAPSCTDLDITPSSFQPVPGGLLLLNYPRFRSMPLWLLDGVTGQTYFVVSGSATADASF